MRKSVEGAEFFIRTILKLESNKVAIVREGPTTKFDSKGGGVVGYYKRATSL